MPAPTRIKICGVTRPEDARAAADAGADAIGMVFYPKARRCISADRAREILAALPAFVTPVALFVDQPADEIRAVATALGIRHIQLHGHESPADVAALRDFTILKAIKADRSKLAGDLSAWRIAIEQGGLINLKAFVLETPSTTAPGGTGVENDWDAIADLQRAGAFERLPPIITAGGLRPDNVAGVIARIRPWAVDVSSGVEERFGEKSAARINEFVDQVARAL